MQQHSHTWLLLPNHRTSHIRILVSKVLLDTRNCSRPTHGSWTRFIFQQKFLAFSLESVSGFEVLRVCAPHLHVSLIHCNSRSNSNVPYNSWDWNTSQFACCMLYPVCFEFLSRCCDLYCHAKDCSKKILEIAKICSGSLYHLGEIFWRESRAK